MQEVYQAIIKNNEKIINDIALMKEDRDALKKFNKMIDAFNLEQTEKQQL